MNPTRTFEDQSLEDPKSRALATELAKKSAPTRPESTFETDTTGRRLKSKKDKPSYAGDDVKQGGTPIKIKQKKYDADVLPSPDDDTRHALMIDAGSQGTRIHIYEFETRILYTAEELTEALNGFKLSIPTTNTRWTNRLKPGLDELIEIPGADNDEVLERALIAYLGPLLEFARDVLDDKEHRWGKYPIYLKATGGLRTLQTPKRVRLIDAVRNLFQNKTFNPFNFDDIERVRVISGEEEAIYGWAAVNFALGTLVQDTEGTGTVLNPHRTWGMLEMGGASTQIAWFQNDEDVMANLIKLQIGAARHWNVYAHSFLYFGINGAWSRLNAKLYGDAGKKSVSNPCLPKDSSMTFESWIHFDELGRPLPRSDDRSTPYKIEISNDKYDYEECKQMTRELLRKETNKGWVEFSHDGDCSFAGVYQPPLPEENSVDNEFILTANYYDVWTFLQLPRRSTLQQLQEKTEQICHMTAKGIEKYLTTVTEPVKDDALYQYCFRATFMLEMLHTGYGFRMDYELTAADVVNGQKLGWALGSTLYEINTLPWEFGGDVATGPSSVKDEASNPVLSSDFWTMGIVGSESRQSSVWRNFEFLFCCCFVAVVGFSLVSGSRRRRNYQPIGAN